MLSGFNRLDQLPSLNARPSVVRASMLSLAAFLFHSPFYAALYEDNEVRLSVVLDSHTHNAYPRR